MLQRVLLAIVLLEIPIQIDINLFHDEGPAMFGAISGFNISLTTFAITALLLMWLPGFVQRSAYPGSPRLVVNLPLLAYFACSLASLVTAYDRELSLFGLCLLAQVLAVFLYVANTTRTAEDFEFVLTMLLCGLLLQGAIMAATRIVADDLYFSRFVVSRIDNTNLRVGGTIGSPITAAGYLGLMLPTAVGVFACRNKRWLKTLALMSFVSGTTGLVLTLSRGGWIGVSLATTALIYLCWRRRLISARLPLVVGGIAILAGVVFAPAILGRLTEDDRGSAEARLPLMKLASYLIVDHPVFGVGVNNCQEAGQSYRGLPEFREEWYYTVHNKYLVVLAEVGVVGFIAYLAFLCSTIRIGWRSWLRLDSRLAPAVLGMTLAIVGQMVHMTVDVFNSRPQVQMLWLVAGLIAAAGSTAVQPGGATPRTRSLSLPTEAQLV